MSAKVISLAEARAKARSFPAQHEDICWNCIDPILIGDRVTYWDDEVVHVTCIPTPPEPHICGTCHVAKPCYCEEYA